MREIFVRYNSKHIRSFNFVNKNILSETKRRTAREADDNKLKNNLYWSRQIDMRVIEFVVRNLTTSKSVGFSHLHLKNFFLCLLWMAKEFLNISVYLWSHHWHGEIFVPKICIHWNRKAQNKLLAYRKKNKNIEKIVNKASRFKEIEHWVLSNIQR